jgi:hypothetical protein
MKQVLDVVNRSRAIFRDKLLGLEMTGGLTLDRYVRFLSMQYHLTKDVQRHFFACAAHPTMAHKKTLRKFLINFGQEEELHFLIAAKDLENLDAPIQPACLDVQLWWAFFNQIVSAKPFIRLGATCILENISSGNGDVIKKLMSSAGYLNPRNTRFLVIHQHEELPHGDQILDALNSADLSQDDIHDLEEGAKVGMTLYLRMFEWVIKGNDLI